MDLMDKIMEMEDTYLVLPHYVGETTIVIQNMKEKILKAKLVLFPIYHVKHWTLIAFFPKYIYVVILNSMSNIQFHNREALIRYFFRSFCSFRGLEKSLAKMSICWLN